ncbi:MAG: PQQ-binding-like beta-propeller repeat protein [Pyrinomonadaceae bacterium]
MTLGPGDGDGFLISVDSETGKPNFVFKCRKCYVSNPVGYDDLIIITTREIEKPREGSVKAVNASTGKLEWSYPIRSSLVPPTVHDGVLYFMEGPSRPNAALAQSSETIIHGFDLKSQKIKWSFKAKGTFDTPAISDGVMFAASNRDYIYAIDLSTGTEKWRFKAEARNPSVRNGTVFFSDSSSLYAIDSTSGALRWKTKIPGGVDQALAVSKSRVFFSSGNNRFHAVDATS